MSGVCFVDTETTGLDPARHEIWEVGLIVDDVEYQWLLPVHDLREADDIALSIGWFHVRHPQGNAWPLSERDPVSGGRFARQFAELTHERHLVGAVVSFDADRLWRLLVSQEVKPSWHYHLIDVEALAVGYYRGRGQELAMGLPWKSEDLSLAIGVDPAQFDKHTALGDARWAKAIYEKVMGS